MSHSQLTFIDLLKKALLQELPGINAQFAMAPPGREKRYPEIEKLKGFLTGAVCILLYEKNGTLYFPVIERADYGGIHSGQLALPGGKLDVNDKDIEECALRETLEEIGIMAARESILGRLTKLYIPPSNFMVHPMIAWHPKPPVFVRNERELKSIQEMPLKNLFDSGNYCNTSITSSGGVSFESPGIRLGKKIIWGATAMILNELKVLIENDSMLKENLSSI